MQKAHPHGRAGRRCAVARTMLGLPPWSIGIAVTLASNVLISLALNCQKLAHMRLEAVTPPAPHERTPFLPGARPSYLRSRLWWLGFTLMALGETGNFLGTYMQLT